MAEFEGHSSEMKTKSTWLAVEDLTDRGDVAVVIEGVFKDENVEFDQGRKEPVVFSISFVGGKKRLVLNATNRKTLVSLYGANVCEWKGQRVTLYVDPNVTMMGKVTGGVRIKSTKESK